MTEEMEHVANISRRLEMVRAKLKETSLDALLVQSSVNRRYLSGFTGSAGALVIGRERAWILVDFRYVEQAKTEAPDFELLRFDTILPRLAELFQAAALKRVGFEAAHVSVVDLQRMEQDIPDVDWVPTEAWVEEIRGSKDADELAVMQQAIDLADEAFEHILGFLTPGRTEKEVALELEFFMRRRGAERLAFPSIVASGPNGALPHAVPSDRALEQGDLVTLDFGCVVDGYASDMTRTVAIGKVDERGRELHDLVLEAQLTGIRAVRPGRLGKEVDAEARSVIEQAGYGEYFGHGLGHGVGLEVHEEFPRLSTRGEVELKPGMVCSVEPGVYIPGWGGIRIEDLVVVTSEGCRVLSRSNKELLIV